jgi:hypothetical protein
MQGFAPDGALAVGDVPLSSSPTTVTPTGLQLTLRIGNVFNSNAYPTNQNLLLILSLNSVALFVQNNPAGPGWTVIEPCNC